MKQDNNKCNVLKLTTYYGPVETSCFSSLSPPACSSPFPISSESGRVASSVCRT